VLVVAGLGVVARGVATRVLCTPDHMCGPSLDLSDGDVPGLVVVGQEEGCVPTVVLSDDGVLVVSTSAGVVGDADIRVPVRVPDSKQSGWAEVVARDPDLGLIVLRLEDPTGWPTGRVAEAPPAKGDAVRGFEVWISMMNTHYGVGDWDATVTAVDVTREVRVGEVMGERGPEGRYAELTGVMALGTQGAIQAGSSVVDATGAVVAIALDGSRSNSDWSTAARPMDQVLEFVARTVG
jgi:hypothetical protein